MILDIEAATTLGLIGKRILTMSPPKLIGFLSMKAESNHTAAPLLTFPLPGYLTTLLPLCFSLLLPNHPLNPSKFFDFLVDHPLFLTTVQKVWTMIIIRNPMSRVGEKLKLLQQEFKSLNTKEHSAISNRVQSSKLLLEVLQKELGANLNNPATQSKEKEVYKQFIGLARAEESLARQKSRIGPALTF